MSLPEFYGDTWNDQAVSVTVNKKPRDAEWIWWANKRDERGTAPLAGMMVSRESVRHLINPITDDSYFSEVAVGTDLIAGSVEPTEIRHRLCMINAYGCNPNDGPGIYHPVKE